MFYVIYDTGIADVDDILYIDGAIMVHGDEDVLNVTRRIQHMQLLVDDVWYDSAGANITVPDNANDWVFMQDMPYADNISISVNGTVAVQYEPTSMILGTVLPNELSPGTNDGVITWGANPTSVGAVLGSMTSSGQPTVGSATDTSTQDLLPVTGGSDWDAGPAITGALLTNPFRPIVVAVSDNTTLSERQVWVWYGIIFVVFVTVLTAANVRGHHTLTGIAASAAIVWMVVWTLFPIWTLFVVVLVVWLGHVSERSPSL